MAKKLETNSERLWKTLLYTPSPISDFSSKPFPEINKWHHYRLLSAHQSEKAQLKLEWIIFYHTVGKESG